ncbi:hypothetical protein EDC30_108159 [Paucimonas lemoignei]|uniref:Uncharacterized protein n=1 Tax=Paucimonas lemoignei TaxID=29443 RepID=A0A4R3HVJ6_PAULE|nr:hypothetical protein EDC30_108159 [Paucimonas lemoignei]
MLYFRFAYLSCLRTMLSYCGIDQSESAQLSASRIVPGDSLMQLNSPGNVFSSIRECEAATHSGPLEGF